MNAFENDPCRMYISIVKADFVFFLICAMKKAFSGILIHGQQKIPETPPNNKRPR